MPTEHGMARFVASSLEAVGWLVLIAGMLFALAVTFYVVDERPDDGQLMCVWAGSILVGSFMSFLSFQWFAVVIDLGISTTWYLRQICTVLGASHVDDTAQLTRLASLTDQLPARLADSVRAVRPIQVK